MSITLLAWRESNWAAKRQAKLVRALMLVCLAALTLDIPGLLLDGHDFPGARGVLWFFDTAYWLTHIVYCWLWMLLAWEWRAGSERSFPRAAHWFAIPMLLEAAVILSNPWTGWLFTLDSMNMYAPGSVYLPCLVPYYAYMVFSFVLAARESCVHRSGDSAPRGPSMLAYMFLPVCGMTMELVAYGTSWVWPLNALSLLMIYLQIQQRALSDEQLSLARAAERVAQMDAEMAGSRMSIMLSQIQPHFLYNALCVIQDLCHGKAPEAEQATIAFSRFLRGNMDSLKADKPIPFEQELSHTRYYLTLETMRFGPRLRVEYDLKAEAFRLPAMTLQPIVENAVRYGVMKREAGGCVRIASAETETAYVVSVEDDGVGFDPYQRHEDGRTHIGIDNVRQRLQAMCGGELRIKSAIDAGTTATIVLPKGENSLANLCG